MFILSLTILLFSQIITAESALHKIITFKVQNQKKDCENQFELFVKSLKNGENWANESESSDTKSYLRRFLIWNFQCFQLTQISTSFTPTEILMIWGTSMPASNLNISAMQNLLQESIA